MKKRKPVLIALIALIVASAGFWCLVSALKEVQEELKVVNVDWKRGYSDVTIVEALQEVGEIRIENGLALRSVYPYSSKLNERYFKTLRLRFEGKAALGGQGGKLYCDAIITPKVIPGPTLRIGVADVGVVTCELFDGSGKIISTDTSGLIDLMKQHVMQLELNYAGSEGFRGDTLIVDGSLWVAPEGLECKVRQSNK